LEALNRRLDFGEVMRGGRILLSQYRIIITTYKSLMENAVIQSFYTSEIYRKTLSSSHLTDGVMQRNRTIMQAEPGVDNASDF
jgi:hypothetical protein